MQRSVLKPTNRSQSFVIGSADSEIDQDVLDTIFTADTEITDDSPKSGPTRSASLKIRPNTSQRMTLTDTMRQSSLPATDPDVVSLDWPDSELSDIIDVDGERVELRKKNQVYPQKSQVCQPIRMFLYHIKFKYGLILFKCRNQTLISS